MSYQVPARSSEWWRAVQVLADYLEAEGRLWDAWAVRGWDQICVVLELGDAMRETDARVLELARGAVRFVPRHLLAKALRSHLHGASVDPERVQIARSNIRWMYRIDDRDGLDGWSWMLNTDSRAAWVGAWPRTRVRLRCWRAIAFGPAITQGDIDYARRSIPVEYPETTGKPYAPQPAGQIVRWGGPYPFRRVRGPYPGQPDKRPKLLPSPIALVPFPPGMGPQNDRGLIPATKDRALRVAFDGVEALRLGYARSLGQIEGWHVLKLRPGVTALYPNHPLCVLAKSMRKRTADDADRAAKETQ